jgi:S-DNA-T family DNA segregation ATPase FtsK/SpoIIIE
VNDLAIVIEMGRASSSVLQQRLGIGYSRAKSMLEKMHKDGLIGEGMGAAPRKVLPAAYASRR